MMSSDAGVELRRMPSEDDVARRRVDAANRLIEQYTRARRDMMRLTRVLPHALLISARRRSAGSPAIDHRGARRRRSVTKERGVDAIASVAVQSVLRKSALCRRRLPLVATPGACPSSRFW